MPKKIKFQKRLIVGAKLVLVIALVNLIITIINMILGGFFILGGLVTLMSNGLTGLTFLGLIYLISLIFLDIVLTSYVFIRWKTWIFKGLN